MINSRDDLILKQKFRTLLYDIQKTNQMEEKTMGKTHGHYIILSFYNGSQFPVKFLHVDCGRVSERGLEDFRKCKIKCKYKAKEVVKKKTIRRNRKYKGLTNSQRKISSEREFKHHLLQNHYKPLSHYSSDKSEIYLEHYSNNCLYYKKYHKYYKFYMSPNAFKRGERCPYDSFIQKHKKKRITLDSCNKWLLRKSNDTLRAINLSWYNNSSSHYVIVTLQCQICNYVFRRKLDKTRKKCFCPSCAKKYHLYKGSQSHFEKELIQRRGLRYVPGIYMGMFVKIPFLCLKCDKIFYAAPNEILRDRKNHAQCPRCRENNQNSIGENAVSTLLKAFHINFIYGYYLNIRLWLVVI